MTLGFAGKSGIRVHDKGESQNILDIFFKYGYKELDTARMYGEGTTEQVLSALHSVCYLLAHVDAMISALGAA